MPKIESNSVALGTKASDFSLPSLGGREIALSDFAEKGAR
ncbi:hypothetical protein SAMN05216566_101620 [Aureimonas phyllosphaerae]|uniref:Peroxiredoxin n=1 Tax=Aureimonas phyllosphaerae TaxID=1166078 RepID=A0A7W6BSD2_9HYPH|nr:peroxiredoxin [Aureimonas phyllosphaerae]MBB3958646.1 peroxiredoxin [Aureimonas phyllosphaerae]SFF00113.1 hypothetical protein SAMN05216566_101620 [Aureimonas phyllosphaerae]